MRVILTSRAAPPHAAGSQKSTIVFLQISKNSRLCQFIKVLIFICIVVHIQWLFRTRKCKDVGPKHHSYLKYLYSVKLKYISEKCCPAQILSNCLRQSKPKKILMNQVFSSFLYLLSHSLLSRYIKTATVIAKAVL